MISLPLKKIAYAKTDLCVCSSESWNTQHTYRFVTVTTMKIQNSSSPRKTLLLPLCNSKSCPPVCSPGSSAFSRMSSQWKLRACNLSKLASFSQCCVVASIKNLDVSWWVAFKVRMDVNPFTAWRMLSCFPVFDSYENSCYKHLSYRFCVSMVLLFLG